VRLLLDTHVFLWWGEDSRQLKAEVRRRIAQADDVFVSAASAWEASIKVGLGKLRLPGPLLEAVVASGFSPLPIDFAHAEAVRALPQLHTDPFDRMLVGQAQVEGLTLVSRDQALREYGINFMTA
jgi:PIN domain nuclease of toxin-antitoxin system